MLGVAANHQPKLGMNNRSYRAPIRHQTPAGALAEKREGTMSAMNKLLLIVGLTVAVVSPALADEDAPLQIAGATTVAADQVIDLVSREPHLVIVDARHVADYNAGAIEGAVNILDTELTPEKLAIIAPTPNAPLLIYCNGVKCGRAANAVVKALNWGYSNVYYYALGMTEWKAKGLPLVTRQ
jgi:rhodanese-related sulfurtransferase